MEEKRTVVVSNPTLLDLKKISEMLGPDVIIIIDDERRQNEMMMALKAKEIDAEFNQLFDAKLREEERKKKTWKPDPWRK